MNDVGLMFLGGLFTTLIMFYSFMAVFQVPNTAYRSKNRSFLFFNITILLSVVGSIIQV